MKQGFTLIEMIVAVGVFAVAITISLATYLNIADIQKKAGAIRATNDNLNFSLEILMRDIRGSYNYQSGGTYLRMTNFAGHIITYNLSPDKRLQRSVDDGSPIPLSAPEVSITKLQFVIKGQDGADQFQPLATIIINGESGETEKIKTTFNLQTTVSQRKQDS
jgi:prepilin-type N-terminal cleavage/methylation domain-containing protein